MNKQTLNLGNIPESWALTPVNGKSPYIREWQNNPKTLSEIQQELANGNAKGYGLILGVLSNGIVAVDIDGHSAKTKQEGLGELPKTVSSTSERDGRSCHFYQVPQEYWECITHKSIKTGVIGEDGKEEALELRWTGHQQVLPPSIHPDTDKPYQWINSPNDCEVAIAPDWLIRAMAKPEPVKNTPKRNYVNLPDDTIPLETCLSRDSRAALEGSCSKGRNDTGAAIARDLLGTSDYLDRIGQRYHGDPEVLFFEWCSQVGLDQDTPSGQPQTIWKSAQKSSPTPCLSPDKIDGCIKAYQSKQLKETRRVKNHGLDTQVQPDQLLESKINQDEDDLSLDAEHLAGLTNYPKPDSGLLPEVIERAIAGLAERMGLTPELYYADLLAVSGSLIPIGTTLLIDSGTDYHCAPIFWIGTVAETGAMKSPKSKAILNPLIELQYTAEEIYKAELEIWQAQEKSGESTGKKPIGRDYYLSDFTLEYISQTISKQPLQGFTLYMDELAAFFRGFDQYRNGKGSDRARFLSAYDGGAWKSNRKSDDTRVFAKRTGISIIGGIQPSVLQKIMTDDLSSEDGLWARFSWIRLPLTKAPSPSGGKYVIGDLLKGLYRDLGNLPEATYTLSKQAQQLWAIWHDEMEAIKLTEASPILRAIYPKMKERAGRIALISHCINHRDGLTSEVPVETLQKAISFTRWLIAQSKELYAEFGIGDNPEMSRILKFVNRFQGCGEISPQQVKAWWSAKQKPKIQEVRDFMAKVVKLGYAIAKGDPNQVNYTVDITRGSPFSPSPLKPLSDKDLSIDYKVVQSVVHVVQEANPKNLDNGLDRLPNRLHSSPLETQTGEAIHTPWTKWTTVSKSEIENNGGDLSPQTVDCLDCQVDCVPVNSQIEIERDLQTPLTELTAYSKNGIENYDGFTDF